MYIIIFIITGIIIISHQLIKHNDKYLPQTVHSNHFLHSNCCMSRLATAQILLSQLKSSVKAYSLATLMAVYRSNCQLDLTAFTDQSQHVHF